MLKDHSKVRSIKREILTTEKEWAVVEWYSEQLGITPEEFAYQALIKGLNEIVTELKQCDDQ